MYYARIQGKGLTREFIVIHTDINHLNHEKPLERIELSAHLERRGGGGSDWINLHGSSESAPRKCNDNLKSLKSVGHLLRFVRESQFRTPPSWQVRQADPPLSSIQPARCENAGTFSFCPEIPSPANRSVKRIDRSSRKIILGNSQDPFLGSASLPAPAPEG